MRLKVDEVIDLAKKFLRGQAGHDTIKIESVDADKKKGEWVVLADVGFLTYDVKQVVIDDTDGNVLSYSDYDEDENGDDDEEQ